MHTPHFYFSTTGEIYSSIDNHHLRPRQENSRRHAPLCPPPPRRTRRGALSRLNHALASASTRRPPARSSTSPGWPDRTQTARRNRRQTATIRASPTVRPQPTDRATAGKLSKPTSMPLTPQARESPAKTTQPIDKSRPLRDIMQHPRRYAPIRGSFAPVQVAAFIWNRRPTSAVYAGC